MPGKRRSRRWFLSAALSAAIILAFTACGQEEKAESVEITFMHGWGGTLRTHETMQEIYAAFSRENPDIILNCIPYSDSRIAVEKANEMLAIGKMPDIISTNGLSYYVNNAVKCNQAMDLMPYIEADEEWKNQIHPSVLAAWTTSNHHLYTLPDALEVAGYWYNEEYFKQAGIVDAQGEVVTASTWEEFLDSAARIQEWMDETGKGISVFTLDQIQIVEFLFLARLAGENENGLAAAQNSYVSIEKETLDNVLADLEVLKTFSGSVDNIENARQAFSEGRSAIYFNGVWESDVLADSPNKENFRYGNYPGNDGKSLSYISPSSGYVLAKQTDERKAQACIRFMKYMLSDEVQLKIALETGQAPSNPNIDRMRVVQEYPLFGLSIYESYQSQIQLKTIWSVWTEQEVEEVNRYFEDREWLADSRQLLEALNDNDQPVK